MCDILSADTLLAFLLTDRAEVSFADLSMFRDRLQTEVPDILVDISEPALDLALTCYPHVFVMRGDNIARSPTAERFLAPGYALDEFYSTITPNTNTRVRSVLAVA